ncbi:MAG TPA: phospholipase D-like domain-containing protein [Bacteroidales bacterium]|nr:phospholipase D-like domain-containing protein [Acetomicrobium sp.]HRT84125.1 phospholipase D-like domain-containing protein [Bacteroidales bacterium]
MKRIGRSGESARHQNWKNYDNWDGLNMQLEYAEIVTSRPVEKFLLKFYLCDIPMQSLILISPFVSTLEATRVTLDKVCKKATERRIFTYIITRAPKEEYHQQAIDTLMSYDSVELRFNESLHAKLYVCLCQDESQSFALLGSANLTRTSIEKNIEIAMMIYGKDRGREILRELSRWGLERLRTLNETKLVKKMKLQRR